MENNKIGFAEALCILLVVILTHLLLILPKIILQSQGSSSIINIIYITLLALFAVFILNLLYKKFKGMDILDISSFLFGNGFKFIIGLIYIVYMVFIVSLMLRNTSENLKTMYFQGTTTPYITFCILCAIAFINRYNFKTVIKCNLIIVPLISIALIILFFLTTENFVPQRAFPILGNGIQNTFVTGATNIFCFGNILFLLFMMPLLKDYNQFNKLSYTAIALSGFFILLTIVSILFMFPLSISSGSNIPLYLQTRGISVGKLIERVDALYIFIWIINILSYISIITGFIISIFKKITNIQNTSTISYSFIAILFGASLVYENVIQIRELDSKGYKFLSLTLVFGLGFLILLLANIKKLIKKNITQGEKNFE